MGWWDVKVEEALEAVIEVMYMHKDKAISERDEALRAVLKRYV